MAVPGGSPPGPEAGVPPAAPLSLELGVPPPAAACGRGVRQRGGVPSASGAITHKRKRGAGRCSRSQPSHTGSCGHGARWLTAGTRCSVRSALCAPRSQHPLPAHHASGHELHAAHASEAHPHDLSWRPTCARLQQGARRAGQPSAMRPWHSQRHAVLGQCEQVFALEAPPRKAHTPPHPRQQTAPTATGAQTNNNNTK